MIEFPLWAIALAGILPYAIGKKRGPNGTIFTTRALIWSLSISRSSSGKCIYWMLRVPLFERARHLFWGVLLKERHSQHKEHPDEELPAEVIDDEPSSQLESVEEEKRPRC